MRTTKKKPDPTICRLHQLIINFKSAQKDHKAAKSAAPLMPVRGNSFTIDSYKKYNQEMEQYKARVTRFREQEQAAANRLRVAYDLLLQSIPKSLTWFVTEDNKFAVALQTNDNPLVKPELIIRQNPVIDELPQLRTLIIN